MWPHVAGQHAPYLEKQPKAFRSGQRKDSLMTTPMAQPLSDGDIANLAAYDSSLKWWWANRV